MTPEKTAMTTVVGFIALAARTARKKKGVDTIIIRVLTGKEILLLANLRSDRGVT